MTAREAAHRLWPDKVAADAKDDPPPREPTPSQRMDKLLHDARMKNQINTDRDQLQSGGDKE
jgi:hypothetical protein